MFTEDKLFFVLFKLQLSLLEPEEDNKEDEINFVPETDSAWSV